MSQLWGISGNLTRRDVDREGPMLLNLQDIDQMPAQAARRLMSQPGRPSAWQYGGIYGVSRPNRKLAGRRNRLAG